MSVMRIAYFISERRRAL